MPHDIGIANESETGVAGLRSEIVGDAADFHPLRHVCFPAYERAEHLIQFRRSDRHVREPQRMLRRETGPGSIFTCRPTLSSPQPIA